MEFICHLFLASSINNRIFIEETRMYGLDPSSVIGCLEDKISLLKNQKNELKIPLPSGNLLIIISLDLPRFWHG